MQKVLAITSIALVATVIGLSVTTPALAGVQQVDICHLPPGNQPNVQDITVGVSAAAFHILLHEGDYLGSSDSSCSENAQCKQNCLGYYVVACNVNDPVGCFEQNFDSWMACTDSCQSAP